MPAKVVTFRLTDVHYEMLEKIVSETNERNPDLESTKRDVVQKAIYAYAQKILDDEEMREIFDNHYGGDL